MPSGLFDGAIRYERYLDGEHVRVRAHVYINGQNGPALSIRVPTEPLFAEGMHLLQMFSDLKGLQRL